MKIFLLLISPIVYLLSCILPKQKNKWCFGEWFGDKYCDNSKYLFEEARKINKIRPIWITRSQNVYLNVKLNGGEVYLLNTAKGIWHQLTAYVFVSSVNSKDFYFPTITTKSIYIQLWHGSPIKKIGFDISNISIYHRIISNIRRLTIDNYDYLISPAKMFDRVYESAFRVSAEKIIRSPYPRCDGLFSSNLKRKAILNTLGISDTCKIVAYIPTHRDEGKTCDAIRSTVDSLRASKELKDNNFIILFKPHFYDYRFFEKIESDLHFIFIDNNNPLDLYEILSVTDILITDYSSICFDFDITENKIFFHAPDLKSYLSRNRDMYFKYSEICSEYTTHPEDLIRKIINTNDQKFFFNHKSNKTNKNNKPSYHKEFLGTFSRQNVQSSNFLNLTYHSEFNEIKTSSASHYLMEILLEKIYDTRK